jgi:Ca2+-binding EF-hand superfamily protein
MARAAEFTRFDADADGELSLQEYSKLRRAKSQEALSDDAIRKDFAAVDRDGDDAVNASTWLMTSYEGEMEDGMTHGRGVAQYGRDKVC